MHLTTASLPTEFVETSKGIVIGSKFAGHHEHRDTRTGTYFECMPPIIGQQLNLMVSIGHWRTAEHARVRREIRTGGYAAEDVKAWPQPEHAQCWGRRTS